MAPNSQAGKYARLMHAKEAHPDVAIKNFHMPKGVHNQKAADAHRAQGHLKGILLAKSEGHQVAFYTVPWGPRKGATHVICKSCHKEAASVGRLGLCDPGDPTTRPRTRSIEQANKWLDEAPPETLPAIHKYIALMRQVSQGPLLRAKAAKEARYGEGKVPHGPLHQFTWPIGSTKGTRRYQCTKCGAFSNSKRRLHGVSCTLEMPEGRWDRRQTLIRALVAVRSRKAEVKKAIEYFRLATKPPTRSSRTSSSSALPSSAASRKRTSQGGESSSKAPRTAASRRF